MKRIGIVIDEGISQQLRNPLITNTNYQLSQC